MPRPPQEPSAGFKGRCKRIAALHDFRINVSIAPGCAQPVEGHNFKHNLRTLSHGAADVEIRAAERLEVRDFECNLVTEKVVESGQLQFPLARPETLFDAIIERAGALRSQVRVPHEKRCVGVRFKKTRLLDAEAEVKLERGRTPEITAAPQKVRHGTARNNDCSKAAVVVDPHSVAKRKSSPQRLVLESIAKVISARAGRRLLRKAIDQEAVFAVPVKGKRIHMLAEPAAQGRTVPVALVAHVVTPLVVEVIRCEIIIWEGRRAAVKGGRERRIFPEVNRHLASS